MDVLITSLPVLGAIPDRLFDLSLQRASVKLAPNRWSHKDELRHLIDSAASNHQ